MHTLAAHSAQFCCSVSPFRINTFRCLSKQRTPRFKSVSKERTLTPFRMNTYEKQGKRTQFALFWCNVSPFRINTSKSVSKQSTLTSFRMNTYEKQGEGRGGEGESPTSKLAKVEPVISAAINFCGRPKSMSATN